VEWSKSGVGGLSSTLSFSNKPFKEETTTNKQNKMKTNRKRRRTKKESKKESKQNKTPKNLEKNKKTNL